MLPDTILPEIVTLPFSRDDVYGGLAELSGLANASRSGLVLTFETKENVTGSGLLKSPLKEIAIPLEELDTVTLKTNLLGASLTIRTRNMHRLQELPGSHQGQITLGIARKDRDTARRFVSTLNVYQSESVLAKIESHLETSAAIDKCVQQEPALPPPSLPSSSPPPSPLPSPPERHIV